ncbi:MAG: hypothetical protein HY731_12855 [Candidatus Tectomicrobia bacterium]|nr:hypothetical protein [Candidatus Tectomicrobia bacterium]
MGNNKISLLDPRGVPATAQVAIAQRLDDLNGKVVGILSNRKPNADIFLGRIEELLRERYAFAEILKREKGVSTPVSEEVLNELVEWCDFVINAIGD